MRCSTTLGGGANIAKNHKLNNVIAHRCLSIEFIRRVESSEPEALKDEFASELRRIDEFLSTETQENNLGRRMFTMPQKQIGQT